ncbi:MAG TPA: fused MFS/spermidine synthase [Terriglobales bacterium]|nr:fused MFS/spermidine synthase [Terriglobales bacterium]
MPRTTPPAPRASHTGVSSLVLILLLVASGSAALVYQALWVKQVGLIVGVDVYAVTAVVSAFFAGLALGSAFLGARADVSARPLAFYAWLEVGIGITGLATTLLLSVLPRPYVAIEDAIGRAAWALPFLLVGIPATFMGGTLPALLRAARLGQGSIGATSGSFYAANTFGGVLGVLAAPIVLIPWFGVRGAGIAAAAANLLLALWAARLGRSVRVRHSPAGAATQAKAGSATEPRPGSRLALALYSVAGGLAIGLEVVWSQAVVQFISTRAFAFALVLGTYLTGLVIGSALWARFADRVRNPWRAFGLLEVAAGGSALACFALLGPWLPRLQASLADAVFVSLGQSASAAVEIALAPAALLFLPTILLGAAFPAVARLACGAEHIGRDIGAVAALNTLGGIVGTLLTGFLLVPAIGLSRTLGLLAIGAVSVGGIAIVRGITLERPESRLRARLAVGAAALATAAIAVLVPPDHLARLLVAERRGGALDYYEESAGGTVAVIREPLIRSSFRRLYISGVSNSADHMMSRRYMRLQTMLPLLIHQGESRSVLVVGLGTGITCGTTIAWPGLQQRVCAELLPAVKHAVHLFEGNLGVATAPSVDIRITDGRHLLLRDPTVWDVITLEPPPPTAAGVVNLYSRDFYELCRDRLAPNGIMAQWFPLTTQDVAAGRSLVRSFLDVFPHASLWTTEAHETLLVGSRDPLLLDVFSIARRLADPEVQRVLGEVGIASPAALLATYVTDRAGLEKFVAGAPAVTDDEPRLEYAALMRPNEFLRIFQEVFALQQEPPLIGAGEAFGATVRQSRATLHEFYSALWLADLGRPAAMKEKLRSVLAAEGENPYYRFTDELGG